MGDHRGRRGRGKMRCSPHLGRLPRFLLLLAVMARPRYSSNDLRSSKRSELNVLSPCIYVSPRPLFHRRLVLALARSRNTVAELEFVLFDFKVLPKHIVAKLEGEQTNFAS